MPEPEVLYSDVKFTRPTANAAQTFSPSADTTYSEVKIAKKPPPEKPPAGFHEDESSRKSNVTSERVALLVLSVLLAAAAVALGVTVFDNKRTKEELRRLQMISETGNQSLSETKPCSTVQPTCPPPATVTTYKPCPKCEAGWEHHGGKCYKFTTNKASWEESRCSCQSQGGDLVKIDSENEQSFLERRLREVMNAPEDKFWIGLTDSEEEGRWLWVDGSLLDGRWKYWGPNEPDNWTEMNPKGEDCVRMGEKDGAHDLKCWFDKSCKVPHRSICEKPEKTGQRSYVCV